MPCENMSNKLQEFFQNSVVLQGAYFFCYLVIFVKVNGIFVDGVGDYMKKNSHNL